MQQKPMHRHFVALPAFGLFLVIVFSMHSFVPVQASSVSLRTHDRTLSSDGEQKRVMLPYETSLTLDPHTELSVRDDGKTIAMLHGGALIEAPSNVRVVLGEIELQLLRSRTYVLRDASSTTIIPVHAPILVTVHTKTFALLPAQQLRIDSAGVMKTTPVPQTWLAQFSGLGDVRLSTDDHGNSSALLDVSAAESPMAELLAALILLPQASVLDTQLQDRLSDILFEKTKDEFALRTLPLYLLEYPFQISSSLLATWKIHVLRFATKTPTDAAIFLRDISHLPTVLDDAAFPRQAKEWKEALETVATVLTPLLPENERESFRSQVGTMQDYPAPKPRDTVQKPSLVTPKPQNVPPNILLAQTKNMLLEHEALLSSETKVSVDSLEEGTVKIQNFFIAEGGKDVRYDCVYTPSTNSMSTIRREGVLLPNSVTPAQFFH